MSNNFDKKFKKNISALFRSVFHPKASKQTISPPTKKETENSDFTRTTSFQPVSVASAEIGKDYEIVSCDLPENRKCRFFEMGLVLNTAVRILKRAPAGDPIEISARGYSVCIRACDGEHFLLKPL